MKSKTQKIVLSSMLAALCCVATMIIKIPSPLKGYINLGDCVVLLCGWLTSPMYAFLSAGVGSALADVFSGYIIYAPATFVIKGIMALAAYWCVKMMHTKTYHIASLVISGSISEIIMVAGYFVFEGFLYGFAPSVVNIPANTIQGVAGIIVGVFLYKIFKKAKLF